MMKIRNSVRQSKTALYFGAGALAVAVGSVAAPAYAQATDEASDEVIEEVIVVTGSRISNPNLQLSSPVGVIGAEEFSIQQVLSVEDVLRDIPGSAPGIGSQVGNGGNGAATINLRGLGDNRNLVLIDGNRVVPATLAAVVDTNIIPLALLQRVDVFTGGASTAYGADAVVGVVNFITRDNFSGVEVNGTYGISELGDAGQYRVDLTVGGNFADDRGNAVLSFGFTDVEALFQGQRDFSRISLGPNGLPQGSTTSIPVTFRAPIIGQLDIPTGVVGVNPANTFNFAPDNAFRTPLRRFSLYGKARYDITDDIEAFSSVLFSKSTVGFPAAATGLFANPLLLPLSNPFLPAAARNQLCAADANAAVEGVQPFLTQAQCDAAALATSPTSADYREIPITAERRFTELGPRFTEWTTTTFQFNGGVRGALTDSINWEVRGSYGESERITESLSASTAALQQAVRATNPNTCTVTTGGCVPFNLFGPEGSVTEAQANFLRLTTFNFVKTSFTGLEAGLSGDLGVTSPFASTPIGFAVGVEYRNYTGESFGDAISRQPGAVLGAGAAALPIAGDYNSREVYAELIVPLVEDKPFIQSLTVEGGIRYADYSTSGGNTTWKAGGSWEPVDGVKFRGVYSRAVRAPNIGELFQPQVVALSNLTADPCQGQTSNPAITATFNARLAGSADLRALCIATGVPAGALGTGSIPAPSAGQIQTTQGGNPLLDPEVATTITAGVVLQPDFVPGLVISADWYKILVEDAITNPTVLDVVNGCYETALNPTLSVTTPACGLVGRSPIGRLDGAAVDTPGIFLGLSNQGRIETSGIDVSVNYTRDIGFATFVYTMNANYTFENLFQATPASVNRECIGFFSASCNPVSEFSLNQRTTLRFDAIDVSLNWRHLSEVIREPLASAILPAFSVIPAYDLFDLGLAVNVTDNLRLNLAVSNLLDEAPPIVGNQVGTTAFNAGNTFPSTYDVFGRRYNVGVNLRF